MKQRAQPPRISHREHVAMLTTSSLLQPGHPQGVTTYRGGIKPGGQAVWRQAGIGPHDADSPPAHSGDLHQQPISQADAVAALGLRTVTTLQRHGITFDAATLALDTTDS